MHLRKIKFLVIGKEPNINTNVPLVWISFRIAIFRRKPPTESGTPDSVVRYKARR